jgi:hypothetical protein
MTKESNIRFHYHDLDSYSPQQDLLVTTDLVKVDLFKADLVNAPYAPLSDEVNPECSGCAGAIGVSAP